jgi:hypothetical protein
MSPALFVIIADASFPAIDAVDGAAGTQKIQNAVSMGAYTYYITSNLTPPAGSVYVARLLSTGQFIVSQSHQPALGATKHTFAGWTIP